MYMIIHVRHVYNYLIAVGVKFTFNGQRVEILGVILCKLLAIHAQTLAEIAITIKETNTTKVNV